MKWYLNGFPKSGLHLLEALLKPITDAGGIAGNYMYGSWAFDRAPLELLTYKLSYLPDNGRVIGHSCYDEDLDLFLYYSGIGHVFIYRDLRDVAVSQAYHILHPDKERFSHPDKELYQAMDSFEDVLAAIWHGFGDYPGVEKRWDEYKTWLESSHTLCLEFGDVVADLERAAITIGKYRQAVSKAATGVTKRYRIDDIGRMVDSALDTDASPTFRRGIPGEWQQYRHVFEREHERA